MAITAIAKKLLNNLTPGAKTAKLGDLINELHGRSFSGGATTEADGLLSKEDKAKLDGIAVQANKFVLGAATDAALGGVMQGAAVADAVGAAPTAAEYKALLDSLRAAGVIALS